MKINETIKNKLKLLSILNDFEIESNEEVYVIKCKYFDEDCKELRATINLKTGETKYYMTDIYDNSSNCEEIDLEQLRKLQELVELLKGE